MSPRPDDAGAAHRGSRRLHRPATLLTAVVAAGSVALAGYALPAPASDLSPDAAGSSLSQAVPAVGSAAVGQLRELSVQQQAALDSVRADRGQVALADSVEAGRDAADAVQERAAELAAEREAAAERQAAAEQEAAEQEAAAEKAAEQQAAAEQEAAEQEAAAEQHAAAEQAARPAQGASRSSDRAAAPAPSPAPAPAPTGDPRSVARGMLASYGWGADQFGCLDSLWARESGWNPSAQNPSSGAYGIPQSLPGNKMASAGSDWQTNPATQIRWGLGYIDSRYGSPCAAWAQSESVGWY